MVSSAGEAWTLAALSNAVLSAPAWASGWGNESANLAIFLHDCIVMPEHSSFSFWVLSEFFQPKAYTKPRPQQLR